MSDLEGFEDVGGHLFPSAQVRYMRFLLDKPDPTIERTIDRFMEKLEGSSARVAPTLLLHWFYLLRTLVPFTENMLGSAELHFCIALAHRIGFSLKEILMMSALVGSGEKSHEVAVDAMDNVVSLLKRLAEEDGIEVTTI
jgi:hypothetical protein